MELGHKGGPIVTDVLAPDQPNHIVSLAFWTHFPQVLILKGKATTFTKFWCKLALQRIKKKRRKKNS